MCIKPAHPPSLQPGPPRAHHEVGSLPTPAVASYVHTQPLDSSKEPLTMQEGPKNRVYMSGVTHGDFYELQSVVLKLSKR
jgi:hypothetical protein